MPTAKAEPVTARIRNEVNAVQRTYAGFLPRRVLANLTYIILRQTNMMQTRDIVQQPQQVPVQSAVGDDVHVAESDDGQSEKEDGAYDCDQPRKVWHSGGVGNQVQPLEYVPDEDGAPA